MNEYERLLLVAAELQRFYDRASWFLVVLALVVVVYSVVPDESMTDEEWEDHQW